MRRILVTSALPYANGPIHLGHLVEYIQTDIWVRYHKLRGRDCLYVCADDTHGTAISIRAQREGITPDELVARMNVEHRKDFAGFHIGFDNYYTTNSEENRLLAEEIYLKNKADGHIHVASVRQAFCPKDAMFLPDRYIRGECPSCGAADQYGDACEACSATYGPTDLRNPRCSECGSTPIERESEHYFFCLGDFEPFLKEWTRSGTLQPEMANKLDEWFTAGLKNWDISRDAPYFGFGIPDAPGKYFYVWLDAPIGYMASTWDYCKKHGQSFDSYWRRDDQAEVYHFIGKDILYFHTLFWPAMLHGAGFRTPTAVFAHGFLTVNGQKMSKSRGTFINAAQYLELLDPEYLRYFYAAKLTGRVDDLDLNLDDFIKRVNSDLVGKLVNIASRSAGFITKRFAGQLAPDYPDDGGLFNHFVAAGDEIAAQYEAREFGRAMNAVMRLAEEANQFVESRAPWTLAKDPANNQVLQEVCTIALNLFRLLITYTKPVLPMMAKKVEHFLGGTPLTWDNRQTPLAGQAIRPYEHLMTRVDEEKVKQLTVAEQSILPPPPTAAEPLAPEIGIEQFQLMDLRVARIVEAEAVPGADKLLRLVVDLGSLGQRQIFAGIKSAYTPETLIGRLTVIVANLKPRKMSFGLSEGMALAASAPNTKGLWLLAPDSGAQPGMRIR